MYDDNEQETRLQRAPTHQKCVLTDSGQLRIGYEIFSFRGGAPPYRGFHYNSDEVLEISENTSWDDLSGILKSTIDPTNRFDLEFVIYSPGHSEYPLYSESSSYRQAGTTTRNNPEMTVRQAFLENNIHLRVYQPMGRGMVDIGKFESVLDLHQETDKHATISLRSKDSFTPDEIKQLIASFNSVSDVKFQMFEKLPALKENILKDLQEYADKAYEEKKTNPELVNSPSISDFQIPLSRTKLTEFIGEEALKQLDSLFGETSNDIVLRRCDYLNHCIDFHVDYAYKTLQVALNDDSEYEGGRLVFVSNGKLEIPKRKSGTITLHEKNIIHGVTALRSGVRYGLLILNRPLSI
jgi:hypothetical protein